MNIKQNKKYALGSLLLMMITTLFLTAQRPGPGGYTYLESDNNHPDFNNDGYADLVISATQEDIESSNAEDAGAVHVIYGSANGLDAIAASAVIDDQVWYRSQAGLNQYPIDDDDRFGTALSFGDFNDDGYDDLAMGAPGSIVSGYDNAGAVHVLYGSANGLTSQGSQAWSQDSFSISDIAESGDEFGSSLAAGDFDDDGYDDLAVGVIGEGVNGVQGAGAINIIYGTAAGLSGQFDEFITQATNGFLVSTTEEADHFGHTLVAADFDNDGVEDLAVGTPEEDSGVGYEDAGMVQIIFGSDTEGLVQPNETVLNPQTIRADTPGVENTMEAGDLFGFALAAADFDDDGNTDLAIGVPGEDHGSGETILINAGAVNVVFGSSGGLDPAAGAPIFHQNTPGITSYAVPGERFGYSLAAADFNHDGFDDLAISAPWEYMEKSQDGIITYSEPADVYGPPPYGSGFSYNGVGIVHILFSNTNGPATPNDVLYDPYEVLYNDQFGTSLTALDTNGDDFIDLAVGVPYDVPPGVNAAPGSVFVFQGLTGSGSSTYKIWYQGLNGLAGKTEHKDWFGAALPQSTYDQSYSKDW